MIRALLLDLDDTLFDRRVALVAWLQRTALDELGRELSASEIEALVAADQRGLRPRPELAAELAALGIHVDPSAIPHLLAAHLVPEPGVRETIGELARTKRVAIITNGGRAQRAKLARLELADRVHQVFVSAELALEKPDRAFFEHALAWTGMDACDVLVVGDQPAIDLAPAKALGMQTAWRVRGAWPTELAPPDFTIHSIAELGPIVQPRPGIVARGLAW